MRLRLLLLLMTLAGCTGILGIETRNPRPDDVDADASIDGTDGSTTDSANEGTSLTDSAPPSDVQPPGIDCLGAQRDAFFCDGFESDALAPTWTPILLPDTTSAKFYSSTQYKLSGARGGVSRFSPLPNDGKARVAWKRPGGAGPLAIQFAVYVESDAWSAGQDVPIGGLRSATSSVLVYFVPNGTDSNGRLEIRFQTGGSPPPPVNLGAVKVNGWQCVELVHDGTNVTSYLGPAMKASTPVAVSFDTVEVGFDWPYTGNTNAAKAFAYDDVVIAPDRIGCLTN